MKTITRDLAVIAADIRERIETVGDIIAIGGLLREAKLQLRHGAFGPWLASEFDFSERTAQNYMRAHKFAGKNATVADLKLTPSALYYLAEGYFEADDYDGKYPADQVALVLKEAAEKRVTRQRVEEIMAAAAEASYAQEWGLAEEESPAPDTGALASETTGEAEAEPLTDAQKAEAAAILDGGSELLPPTPSPTPQATPRKTAILTTFEDAIKALQSVVTKPASQFKPTFISATDLQTIADFLRQVAAVKGAS